VSALRRGLLVPGLFVVVGGAVLLGLGTWQIERKVWKEALIATLTQRLNAVPVALPPPDAWPRLTADDAEFTRVRIRLEFPDAKDATVYTSGSALRDDVKGQGYFVFALARLPGGQQVVVNRGYAPDRIYPRPSGPLDIIGVLRWPESSSWFVNDRDAAGTTWFRRDQRLMAEFNGWGPVAPFYIEQEGPVPPGGRPHPTALKVTLRNDHLQYAITWYSLALVLLIVFAVWARGRRRAAQP
jgi:surfeit locus 1 family protein